MAVKNKLSGRWNKREKDFWVSYPESRADGNLLLTYMGSKRTTVKFGPSGIIYTEDPSLLEELDRRGYDLTTIKFSIEKKKEKS